MITKLQICPSVYISNNSVIHDCILLLEMIQLYIGHYINELLIDLSDFRGLFVVVLLRQEAVYCGVFHVHTFVFFYARMICVV
jgi:hypothetical protein